MAFNYVFVGLGDKTINVPSVKDITLDDLKHKIEQRASFIVNITCILCIIPYLLFRVWKHQGTRSIIMGVQSPVSRRV